jgi:glycosyltransferase involved in cell wall biosynthesis
MHPRFFSVPGAFKWLDGYSMAVCALPLMWRLRRKWKFDLIDSHFAYPDGYAATLLGRWLKVPVTVTLRGTEVPISRSYMRRRLMIAGLKRASRIFAVAGALKQHVTKMGVNSGKITVIGNGVDTTKFCKMHKATARACLGISPEARVLISVGALVERKGMHRVIECLPRLKARYPDLQYLIVGGGGAEGNCRPQLERLTDQLGLRDTVRFLGPIASDDLKLSLSAADVFVLPTRNEGWANVFLEAMACGLPVVTTDVGGNREVVCSDDYGKVVPFGAPEALVEAIGEALERNWDETCLVNYARANSWDRRVTLLVREFSGIVSASKPLPVDRAVEWR